MRNILVLFSLFLSVFAFGQDSFYYEMKSTVNSHKLNLSNTIRYLEDKCGSSDELQKVVKPVQEKYNVAFEIFNKIDKNNPNIDSAYKLADALEAAFNELEYSSKYGMLYDFHKKCINRETR